ncbi:MAG: DUF6711 family protein [Acutalibacteraceae bacterium]
MIDDFKVVIDGVSLEFFSEPFGGTYSWIVDAYRNANDTMIITHPVKKRTLELKAKDITKEQFRKLAGVVGKTDIRHTVVLYNDLSGKPESYKMYNSDLKYTKKRKYGTTVYDSVSFSLIEM